MGKLRKFAGRIKRGVKRRIANARLDIQGEFTIVAPAYNAAPYLDDFFKSLESQTIGKKRLRIIVVDDGSTDTTADVVRAWQKKWPKGIRLVQKENGGVASARNLGMSKVKTEWVTFMDPDDFVDKRYFEEAHKFINKHKEVQLIATHWVKYFEEDGRVEDNHAMSYRFKNGTRYFAFDDEHMFPQFSMATAFFRMSHIRVTGLLVDEELRPSFEDTLFVNTYLLSLTGGGVAFLDSARYYYRKRKTKNSLMDKSSYANYDMAITTTERGCLRLLEFAQEQKGYVPRYAQLAVTYHMNWGIRGYLNNPKNRLAAISKGFGQTYYDLLTKIFTYIDYSTLVSMPTNKLWFPTEANIRRVFYGQEPDFQTMYVRRLDLRNQRILFEVHDSLIRFELDGKPLTPYETKRVRHEFVTGPLFYSYRLWIAYSHDNQKLTYHLPDKRPVRINSKGQIFETEATISQLLAAFTKDWGQYPQEADTWLFIDRDTEADDNAEHLYRYVAHTHPEQPIVFGLSRESKDWDRLEKEGFNLRAFSSEEYESALINSSKIISSHIDGYIINYFKDNNYKLSKEIEFLGHGITHHDLSDWLNPRPITHFITALEAEHDFIAGDDSTFLFTPSQVPLTGLPRFDNLLRLKKEATPATILVMPTWRKWLVGDNLIPGMTSAHELKADFLETEYCKRWTELLSSQRLYQLADTYNCRIVFFPHSNILPYLETGLMVLPDYVELGSKKEQSLQAYLAEAKVFITDYTSVAFDAAYIGLPMVYYQFDRDEVYSGEHTIAPGYFEHERDGFGPVAYDLESALDAVEAIAAAGFESSEEYVKRAESAFVFRDGNNCERVYKAITA